jgi:hypothetical protein
MYRQQRTGWWMLASCGLWCGCGDSPTATTTPSMLAGPPPAVVPTPPGSAGVESPHETWDDSQLIEQSAELTRLVLSGNATAAHPLFSPAYRDRITPAALSALSVELQQLLGADVSRIDFLDTQFGPVDADTQTEVFLVRHLVQFGQGKQAIAAVQFYLPLEATAADAGELAAIDIRQTWPSFSPATWQVAQECLKHLFPPADTTPHDTTPHDAPPPQQAALQPTSAVAPPAAARWLALFHPHIVAQWQQSNNPDIMPEATWERLVANLRKHLGPLKQQPDWSTWSYQTVGKNLSVRGQLTAEKNVLELQLDFSQEQLVGLTCICPTYAVSTLDLIEPQRIPVELGKSFWQLVFQRQFEAAHQLLSTPFQQQLPIDQFTTAISEIEFPDGSTIQSLELAAVRCSTRLERADPLAITACYVAQLESGEHLVVQCEFAGLTDPKQLTYFANEFEATIPVSDPDQARTLVTTFLGGEAHALQLLLDEAGRQHFAPDIAHLFLLELKRILGDQPPAVEDIRVLQLYHAGERQTQINANLVTPHRSIRFEAVTQADKLKSFSFDAPELKSFLRNATGIGSLEELGQLFLQRWLKENQIELAAGMMVAPEQWPVLLEQLSQQRDNLVEANGRFLWSDLISWDISHTSNELRAIYELEFADKTVDMELTFQVHAIGAQLSAAQLLSEVE